MAVPSLPGVPPVILRSLVPEEVFDLAALARVVWQSAYGDIISQEQIDYMLAQRYSAPRLLEELQRPDLWWDQAFAGGRRVGFAATQLTETPGEMKLDKLYVHPENQRQGIGAALLDHVAARARRQGCQTLILAVNKHNAPAIAAYTKHGFGVREPVRLDIGHGFVMDDFIMTKSLT